MSKKTFFCLFLLSLVFLNQKPIWAYEEIAASSACFFVPKKQKDQRAEKLKWFLIFYRSPLAPYSALIVKTADRYSLDWRLLVAISGVESTFGREILPNSFNAYGWNNGRFYFQSWQDGIKAMSQKLKENYLDKGAKSVEQIGLIYAESPTWAKRVKSYMRRIEKFSPPPLQFSL